MEMSKGRTSCTDSSTQRSTLKAEEESVFTGQLIAQGCSMYALEYDLPLKPVEACEELLKAALITDALLIDTTFFKLTSRFPEKKSSLVLPEDAHSN
jgi:hypothetical protein